MSANATASTAMPFHAAIHPVLQTLMLRRIGLTSAQSEAKLWLPRRPMPMELVCVALSRVCLYDVAYSVPRIGFYYRSCRNRAPL